MCRGAKAIFVEREDGRFRLRRGFTISPGARVLMVEDIITTASPRAKPWKRSPNIRERSSAPPVSSTGSGGKAEIGVRRVALATLDIPAYPADALPPELAAIPAVKPASRALEERKFAFPI